METDLLIDATNATPLERFSLMLMERVQALESTVALLEHEATTDALRATVTAKGNTSSATPRPTSFFPAMNWSGSGMADVVHSLLGTAPVADADVREFADALGDRLLAMGIDVAEVVVERNKQSMPSQGDGISIMPGIVMTAIESNHIHVTVKLSERRLEAELSKRLTLAVTELTPVGKNGLEFQMFHEWRRHAANAASSNAFTQWTWKPHQRCQDVALAQVGLQMMMMAGMMTPLQGTA